MHTAVFLLFDFIFYKKKIYIPISESKCTVWAYAYSVCERGDELCVCF